MTKIYLGDQVYVEWTGRDLFLTTHNGICATNTIVLEPPVLDKLVGFLRPIIEPAERLDEFASDPVMQTYEEEPRDWANDPQIKIHPKGTTDAEEEGDQEEGA